MVFRPNIQDRHFDWKRGGFVPPIDPYHFRGKSPSTFKGNNKKVTTTPVNLKKEAELLTLEVFLPSFHKEEIDVSVMDNTLFVRAKRLNKPVRPSSRYIINEFETDVVEHTFRLAAGIGHEQIDAKLENGILYLTFTDVPKAEEKVYQLIEIE